MNENLNEKRNVVTNNQSPEILTNNIYTPAFLREQLGKLVRVEFLIGTNNLTDRTGILEDVGVSYILLRSIESGNLLYCDIYLSQNIHTDLACTIIKNCLNFDV